MGGAGSDEAEVQRHPHLAIMQANHWDRGSDRMDGRFARKMATGYHSDHHEVGLGLRRAQEVHDLRQASLVPMMRDCPLPD